MRWPALATSCLRAITVGSCHEDLLGIEVMGDWGTAPWYISCIDNQHGLLSSCYTFSVQQGLSSFIPPTALWEWPGAACGCLPCVSWVEWHTWRTWQFIFESDCSWRSFKLCLGTHNPSKETPVSSDTWSGVSKACVVWWNYKMRFLFRIM